MDQSQAADYAAVQAGIDELRSYCCQPEPHALRSAVDKARQGDAQGRQEVCGALLWTAFAAPSASRHIYDLIASTWLNTPLGVTTQSNHSESQLGVVTQSRYSEPGLRVATPSDDSESTLAVPVPDGFWTVFAQTVLGPDEGYDASSITATVASLGGAVDEGFGALAEAAACTHSGMTDAEQRAVPPLLQLETLKSCAPGTLGGELYQMLTENGFDPEVLDREAIGLAGLSPALRYANTRILQMHDVWHLVAGYQTTSLHEIAISGFQLAQFGHNYSAMFLATVACISHIKSPAGFGVLVQNICEAWQHGRSTPSMMDVEWETFWQTPLTDVREHLGIAPFNGSFPADLFEQLSANNIATAD